MYMRIRYGLNKSKIYKYLHTCKKMFQHIILFSRSAKIKNSKITEMVVLAF